MAKGIHLGKTPSVEAIKSSEIFQSHYKVYRNDRSSLGGRVFVPVHKDIISEEQPDYVTECEIEWVKVHLKGKKVLFINSFYMHQRKPTHLDEL